MRIIRRLGEAVRANKVMYMSHSAGTMVTAKSMELTGEIKPGSLETFAVNKLINLIFCRGGPPAAAEPPRLQSSAL